MSETKQSVFRFTVPSYMVAVRTSMDFSRARRMFYDRAPGYLTGIGNWWYWNDVKWATKGELRSTS